MPSSETPDIRWRQRLQNFHAAYAQLGRAVEIARHRKLSELEEQGLIQAFEFTHELAWNVMKDYFRDQGGGDLITGSKDATREAFNRGLLRNGETWMDMIRSRNLTSHTYNQTVAEEIARKIRDDYFPEFSEFSDKMTKLAGK